MVSFGERLHERCVDVGEWVDYRPDPDFRWLSVLPFLLAGGWLYGSMIGLGLAVALALMVTVVVALAGLFGVVLWIVANAAVDLAYSVRLPSRERRIPVKVVSDRS